MLENGINVASRTFAAVSGRNDVTVTHVRNTHKREPKKGDMRYFKTEIEFAKYFLKQNGGVVPPSHFTKRKRPARPSIEQRQSSTSLSHAAQNNKKYDADDMETCVSQEIDDDGQQQPPLARQSTQQELDQEKDDVQSFINRMRKTKVGNMKKRYIVSCNIESCKYYSAIGSKADTEQHIRRVHQRKPSVKEMRYFRSDIHFSMSFLGMNGGTDNLSTRILNTKERLDLRSL